ncbi:MAG: hypothetical protein ACJAQT_002526 [Akkermansiaceae bacterium]|jgi:hypothetical protein
MFRLLPSQLFKALIVAFFCSLGASAKDGEGMKPQAPLLLALKEVHPKSDELAPQIKAGTQIAPPGYKLYQLSILDDEGQKKVGQRPILLKRRNIVTGASVQSARSTAQIGTVAVLLTKEGGEKVRTVTKKMNFGVDRIAVVVEGQCQIAPTIMAALGRDFVVNGLDGKPEVKRLVKALNAQDTK